MRRKKRNIIIIISVIAVILVAFFSYYGYAYSKVRDFTVLEPQEIALEGDLIDIGGVDIHYIKKGDSDKKMILLHGIGAGTFSYRYNIDELARHYEVYAIDLKGFGYSERMPGTDHSYDTQAKIVLGFMESNGIKKATIAGHSMGGAISLVTYSLSPDSFEGLILIDSAGITTNDPAPSFLLTQPVVDILYYNLMVKRESFRDFLSSAYYNKDFVDDELIELYNRPFRLKDTNRSYLSILKSDTDYDFEGILASVEIPVLIIWGEKDTWIDIGDAYRFEESIEDATLKIIPGAGHLPMEEKSGAVNKAIIDFMEDRIKG